jgi:dTMP kinase
MTARGRFLTLEGLDGAGKSTQLAFVQRWLAEHDVKAVFTREPGGTAVGESLRNLLLSVDTEVSLDTETLLMFAARNEHIVHVIEPALARGLWWCATASPTPPTLTRAAGAACRPNGSRNWNNGCSAGCSRI